MSEIMHVDEQPAATESAVADLRRVDAFADLPEDQLTWLAAQAAFQDLEIGDIVVAEGVPIYEMVAVISGELRSKREH
ncbi:MAG: hypothetical protein ACRENP_19365, partial [Longimicrobiales bacterium]